MRHATELTGRCSCLQRHQQDLLRRGTSSHIRQALGRSGRVAAVLLAARCKVPALGCHWRPSGRPMQMMYAGESGSPDDQSAEEDGKPAGILQKAGLTVTLFFVICAFLAAAQIGGQLSQPFIMDDVTRTQ